MKTNGSDWIPPPEKSAVENVFDQILLYRQSSSLFAERFHIIKELERLLSENQTKFAEYLSDVIGLYENECAPVLNVDENDPGPVPEEIDGHYYKNTPLAAYLILKRRFILKNLQEIEVFWQNKQEDKIKAKMDKMHQADAKMVLESVKKIEFNFPLLEKMTMKAIEESSDNMKNEKLKNSLEEMRQYLKKAGFNV